MSGFTDGPSLNRSHTQPQGLQLCVCDAARERSIALQVNLKYCRPSSSTAASALLSLLQSNAVSARDELCVMLPPSHMHGHAACDHGMG